MFVSELRTIMNFVAIRIRSFYLFLAMLYVSFVVIYNIVTLLYFTLFPIQDLSTRYKGLNIKHSNISI